MPSSLQLICLLIWCSLVLFEEIGAQEDNGPIVQLETGSVRGLIRSTPQGREFYAFLGIPYAKPPTGDLRFRPPVPVDPWDGVYNATAEAPLCMQLTFEVPVPYTGVEDCLQLNVYTPMLNESTSLVPVHVFIHGGDYFAGDITSTHFGPERYMNTEMVVVLMNYRVDALGFLSTEDESASGNFGLLDQNLALQWVRDNVAAFGGDRNDVTLSGQSAGSSSVISHILSPMSAGLFHRAIAESGSALCAWAMEESPLYYARALADRFQCPTDTTAALVDCLRQQDAGEIVKETIPVMLDNLTLSFVPVVENPTTGLFLTEDPMVLLQEGRFNQVPLVMGCNRDEGVLIYRWIPDLFANINDNFFDVILPTIILPMLTDYKTNLINVSYAIKDEYYSNIDLDNQTAVTRTSIDLISDMFMKISSAQTVQLVSAYNVSVYMYDYNYVSSQSESNYTGEPDVVHGQELWYLFNETNHVISEVDQPFGEQLFSLWSNFILHGNPTPSGEIQWETTPPGGTSYLNIDKQFTMVGEYNPDKMNFWLNTVPAIVYA